jgi:ferritin-like metal-binding protein YciE
MSQTEVQVSMLLNVFFVSDAASKKRKCSAIKIIIIKQASMFMNQAYQSFGLLAKIRSSKKLTGQTLYLTLQ